MVDSAPMMESGFVPSLPLAKSVLLRVTLHEDAFMFTDVHETNTVLPRLTSFGWTIIAPAGLRAVWIPQRHADAERRSLRSAKR